MRYSIKEKRRFHFRLTSTARLTKSEPVFQFRSLGLADDDFLGHRHLQVNGQPPVEPQADVGHGLSRHDKLSVGTEEIMRIQLLGQFVERLGENKFFPLTVYRLDQPVGDIEILDSLHRHRQKFIPLHRHQKMRLVILFLFKLRMMADKSGCFSSFTCPPSNSSLCMASCKSVRLMGLSR